MALIKCHECRNEVSTDAKTCPKCGAKVKRSKRTSLISIIIAVFFGYIIFSVVYKNESQKSNEPAQSAPSTTKKPARLEDLVELKINSWSKGGFDNVMLLSFSITNKNTVAIKDVTIGCDLNAPSGTRISTVMRTVHEIVPAGKTRKFNDMNMGLIDQESKNAACVLVTVQEAEAFAKTPTIKLDCAKHVAGIKTDAEMQFDIGGSHIMNVTFFTNRPNKAQADIALRECLAQAIKKDSTKDILAAPWYREHEKDNPDDAELLHPYGPLTALVYTASSKSITIHELKLKPKNP